MRFFHKASCFAQRALRSKSTLLVTGVAVGFAFPTAAYCRQHSLALPEGQTWEAVLSKVFPENVSELDQEEVRVCLKLLGFTNMHLADLLFTSMDLDGNGLLTKDEVVAVAKLLSSNSDKDRAQFLFNAVDGDHNKKISRAEMYDVLYTLLETKFLVERNGLLMDTPDFFTNFTDADFKSYAKYCANKLTQDIFIFADINRDGVLSFKEFFKWYRRGGQQVVIIQHVLDDLVTDFQVANMQ